VAWIYVIIAGLLEIAWTVGLKASEGFTRPGITALTLTGAILSFFA
jgi:quaternary ammonium compound-resistance protein SugE